MKSFLSAALIFGSAMGIQSFAAEVSVFDAGKLDTPNPYGLTESEKVLLKNKKEVDALGKNVGSVKLQVGTLQEQIEGVRSVLEGTNNRLGKFDTKIRQLEERVVKSDENSSTISAELESLKLHIEENRQLQEANYEKIKTVLTELSSLIDSINNTYVQKDVVNALEKRLATLEQRKIQHQEEVNNSSLKSKSGAVLIKEGLSFFEKGQLVEAKERFDVLVDKKYKPARSNYYLGEIAYKQKAWKQAIKHYKISIGLYDKADYTSRLLYHTAISFDKLGDTQSANQFYQALKANYPDTKEAHASPNR